MARTVNPLKYKTARDYLESVRFSAFSDGYDIGFEAGRSLPKHGEGMKAPGPSRMGRRWPTGTPAACLVILRALKTGPKNASQIFHTGGHRCTIHEIRSTALAMANAGTLNASGSPRMYSLKSAPDA